MPTKRKCGSPRGATHIWNGGPPACAIWLVNPVATPKADPVQPGAVLGAATRPPRIPHSRHSPKPAVMAPSAAISARSFTLAA